MDLIRIKDAFAVDGNVIAMCRTCAASNHEIVATQHGIAFVAGYLHRMVVDEARVPLVNHHAVAAQLGFDNFDLACHDTIGTEDEIAHGDGFLHRIPATVEGALAQSAEIQDGFAKRLAGNGAGVNADAADRPLTLDDSNFLA